MRASVCECVCARCWPTLSIQFESSVCLRWPETNCCVRRNYIETWKIRDRIDRRWSASTLGTTSTLHNAHAHVLILFVIIIVINMHDGAVAQPQNHTARLMHIIYLINTKLATNCVQWASMTIKLLNGLNSIKLLPIKLTIFYVRSGRYLWKMCIACVN